MWLLAFDTSTPRCVIALGRVDASTNTAELVERDDVDDTPNQASAQLVARLQAVVARAGLTMADLGGIACGCGPGTFTGTRVAVATAKGLALGLDVNIVPVSTLASVAATAGSSGTVLALLDARRSEVYSGGFMVGDPGVERYADEIPHDLVERAVALPGPRPQGLWKAASSFATQGHGRDPAEIGATYLRASYAELGINRPKRPFRRSPFA